MAAGVSYKQASYSPTGGGGILHSGKGMGMIMDVLGAVTDDPSMIEAGTGKLLAGSPAGNAFGMYNSINSLAPNPSPSPDPQSNMQNMNNASQGALGDYSYKLDPQASMDAINRRFSTMQNGGQ